MIKTITEYINTKLLALNYFQRQYGLCVQITRSDGRKMPAQYLGKGEYMDISNFDKYSGVSYMRKRGSISIADIEDNLIGCTSLLSINVPLKLIVIVPRKKLPCDDRYAEDKMILSIIKAVTSRSSDLKRSLSAKKASIFITSFNTSNSEVLKEEYTNIKKTGMNFKYVYASLDIEANIITDKNCIDQDCELTYSTTDTSNYLATDDGVILTTDDGTILTVD